MIIGRFNSLQIYEKITIEKLTSSSNSGILFLQLTVEDMGICVPLNPLPLVSLWFGYARACDLR